MNILYTALLGLAVSIDGFVAGIAYGLKGIKMPLTSLLIVGAVTTLCTATAMLSANYLADFINPHIAILCGALLLIILGTISLFQEYIAKHITSYEANGQVSPKQLSISIGHLVISIMAKPETADVDHSKTINATEAVFLGLALGVDNMVATFGAALIGFLPLYTPLLMGLIQFGVISSGVYCSSRIISDKMKKQFPYLPGTILILLGLLRIG